MSIGEKLLQVRQDLDMVYEKGKDVAIQAFADAYQDNGERTDYYQRFVQNGWNDKTFSYIRYPIVCKGGSTAAQSVFTRCSITRILVPITVENVPATQMFYYAQSLEEISQLRFVNVSSFQSAFTGCTKLRRVNIGGSIDVSFNISATAVLDSESCQSIIDHLKDLTGLEKQTLTFHKTVGEKLTEEQKAAISAKNWELVLV